MTEDQKLLRRWARREGQRTIAAITNAKYPVYDGDEGFWLDVAVKRARAAWRYALQSQAQADHAQGT